MRLSYDCIMTKIRNSLNTDKTVSILIIIINHNSQKRKAVTALLYKAPTNKN